ncbi:MAG: hypothetical protein JKX81_14755 [Arenicella sp.]|nr:hypothetical protein [Arenicella sp.]
MSNQLVSELSFITQRQPDSTENDIKLWQTPNWFCIEYPRSANHALRFYISMDGSKVVSSKPDAIPDSDVDSFVLGPILGCVLRLRGRVCLHASVLESNGKAFAMIGHKGAGKSTTAAALLEAGARLISDDVAVIHRSNTNQFTVYPGYAGIRLMPDALSAFALNQNDYKLVVSSSDKRIIPLDIWQPNKHANQRWTFQPQACQLMAIYILNRRRPDLINTQITTVPNTRACIELTPHSYARRVINKHQQHQEFAFMAQLTRHIPIKSVDRPNQLSYLPKIAEDLLSDLAATA